jgi:rod shape-determining protein MreD
VRWFLVAILGYACLVLETSLFRPDLLAVQVDGHWTRPDLVLVYGLFLAFYFEPRQVFVAGWCLGLAADLASVSGRLGLTALLAAGILTGLSAIRKSLNRSWVVTQSLLALAVVGVIHAAWYLGNRYLAGAPPELLRSLEQAALDAAYSAIVAPYLFWVLQRLRRPLDIALDGA